MNLKHLLLFVLISFNFKAFSQIPNVIPYQGQISDTSGKAYDGSFTFEFDIQNSAGSSLWNSGSLTVEVNQGNYAVELGESPQTPIPTSVWNNDILFLEISFNDGVNGLETLSPNVQILPVPFAMRAAIADSALSSSGYQWGDSLVLRDASGDVRFIMNPNTGEFKILQQDTIWYEIESNSPPKTTENYGANQATTEYVTEKGKNYTKSTRNTDGYRIETWIQHGTDAGNNDTMSFVNTYDGSNCLVTRTIKMYDKKIKKVKICTYQYDCPAGTIAGVKCVSLAGPTKEPDETEDKTTHTKTEESTDDGKLQMVTVDTRSGNQVKVTADAKDSCFVVEADKIVLKTDSGEFVIKINKDGSISQLNKSNGTNEILKLIADADDHELTIEDKLALKYKFVAPHVIERIVLEIGATQAEYLIEQWNTEAREYISTGLNRLKYLVDSTMEHKVVSKSTQDSIKILYDVFGHYIEMEGFESFRHINKFIESTRNYTENHVSQTFEAVGTGDDFKVDFDFISDLLKADGVQELEFEFPDTTFEERFVYDGNENHVIERKVNPVDNVVTYDGVDLLFKETKGSKITDGFGDGKHEIKTEYDFTDSTMRVTGNQAFIYDGQSREVHNVDDVYEYDFDDGDRIIREVFEPNNHAVEYDGLHSRHHHLDTNFFVQSFVDDQGREISMLFEPSDSILNIDGLKQVELEMGGNIGFLGSLEQNQIVLANYDPVNNIAVGMTMDLGQHLIQFHDPIGQPMPVIMDTLMVQDELQVDGNGHFNGNVFVNGNVSKLGGNFKIDHPQDPYNKYLFHSFVESPDMMNVYNGNIKTDSNGFATVELPSYFDALNMEFRYQLTCLGTFAQAIISTEIKNNIFVVQTDKPNVKVSWQVTGIRKDPYASENRIEVEVDKVGDENGTLLYQPQNN